MRTATPPAESPLVHPTYAHVARHLDITIETKIRSSRNMPPEFLGNPKLELAHNLYWMELSDSVRDHDAALAERCKDGSYPV